MYNELIYNRDQFEVATHAHTHIQSNHDTSACTDTHTDGPFHSSRHLQRQFWPPRLAPQSHIHSFTHRSYYFFRGSLSLSLHAPLALSSLLSFICFSLFLASSVRVCFLFSFSFTGFFLSTDLTTHSLTHSHTEYTSSLVLQENRNQQPTIIKKNVRVSEGRDTEVGRNGERVSA